MNKANVTLTEWQVHYFDKPEGERHSPSDFGGEYEFFYEKERAFTFAINRAETCSDVSVTKLEDTAPVAVWRGERSYEWVGNIELADDDNLYMVNFTQHDAPEDRAETLDDVMDAVDDVVVSGWGKYAGKKGWQLSPKLRSDINQYIKKYRSINIEFWNSNQVYNPTTGETS